MKADILKSNYIAVLGILLITLSVSSQTTIEEIELNELTVSNPKLEEILDSFLVLEPFHNFKDSIYLYLDICNYSWKIDEGCYIEDTMLIEITATTDKSFLFIAEKEGYFIYDSIFCTLQGIILPELFKKTGNSKVIYYEEEVTPTIKIGTCDDFSWHYFYIDGKFVPFNDP